MYFFKKTGDPILVYKETKIYILTPNIFCSGGPECLHQLSDKMVQLGYSAFNYYMAWDGNKYYTKKDGKFCNNGGIQAEYRKYRYASMATEIEDDPKNILICPECWPYLLDEYKNIRKCIFWLSVDFKASDALNKADYHFAQSEYAYQYLIGNTTENIYILQDYISTEDISHTKKENIICYNPRKSPENMDKVMSLVGSKASFIAIENMSKLQACVALAKSKIYIDFGFHPGKDRVPREAAHYNCCVITNKKGSAGNCLDVEIPEKYKLEHFDERRMADLIDDVLINYESRVVDFCSYREKILNEEKELEFQINSIFTRE